MPEPPLMHTAKQYSRVIDKCNRAIAASEWSKEEAFREAEEVFFKLEPSMATAAIAGKFERVHFTHSVNLMLQIVDDLRELYHRARREESMEQLGNHPS